MVYKIIDIIRDVRVCLDQNNVSDALLLEQDVDTLSLQEIIRSCIPEAVRRVHIQAPVHMLESGHPLPDALYWERAGSGHILLPDDFLRLIVFKMSDWERPVFAAITPDDPQYQKQSSRYRGLRGNPQKPVCAIVMRPEGLALEFYSCRDPKAYLQQGLYLPRPQIDAYGGIDICEPCYRAVVYLAAALTLHAIGEAQRAQVLTELSNSSIQ